MSTFGWVQRPHRMRLDRPPSLLFSWMTRWAVSLCSTERCRSTSRNCSWATSRMVCAMRRAVLPVASSMWMSMMLERSVCSRSRARRMYALGRWICPYRRWTRATASSWMQVRSNFKEPLPSLPLTLPQNLRGGGVFRYPVGLSKFFQNLEISRSSKTTWDSRDLKRGRSPDKTKLLSLTSTGNKIYVYVGKDAKRVEKLKAISAANQIRDQDHAGRAAVHIIGKSWNLMP